MAKTDEWLTIQEALDLLKMNGVEMNEPALRMGILRGVIKSKKMFSARVINRDEISRLISDRRSKRAITGR